MIPVGTSVRFAGTTRYQVVARIGQGGMGTVFHVFDRERREDVALKTLLKLSPTTLQMFKREFRALADVAHPNLVSLYEMSVADGVWFFTMELVRGQNFLEHAWGTTGVSEPDTLLSEDEPSRFDDSLRASASRVLSTEALREATAQLVRGLSALHAAGKLHLDVKPANVLVALGERVVLLDFGLVTEITEARAPGARLGGGTWAYMAPERLSRSTVTPASDFYSVGIMLYEALTGRTPFSMRDIDAGLASGRSVLVPPRALVPAVPDWLSDLCSSMLSFDPAARPSGEQILARLGASPGHGELVPLPLGDEEEIFEGRDGPLAALADSFAQAATGRPVSVRLHGPSGIGKTTLVRHFLRGLRLRGQATVLEGRCYDRESVPFKALDTIVDRLTDHLASLPPDTAESLRPPDWQFLTELFPVLRRIRAFAAVDTPVGGDDPERRRRAFAALKVLLARLGASRPLVLLIDDFQWGDVDSALALGDVLSFPHAPPLLLLTCDRGEDAAVALHDLVHRGATPSGGLLERDLPISPLDSVAAMHVSKLLLRRFGQQESLGDAIAEEAEGNPYLLRELAQNPVIDPTPSASGARRASLDRVLAARVAQLPDAARAFLEIVVLSGRPLEQRAAEEAARLSAQDRGNVAMLRAAHLLTVRAVDGTLQVAAYHDRIRQAVSQGLTPERRRDGHLALAEVLEQRKETDPETLHEHLLAAGVRDRAGHYALEAARQAARSLAFDRAATLYRRTIELLDDYERPWELEAGLAEALANAGKGEESGDAYLRAANGLAKIAAGNPSILTWKRRSFEEYLRAGCLEKGNEQMYAMAAAVGLRLPRSRGQKLAGLLLERAKLGTRKMAIPAILVVPAEGSGPSPLLLDVCWGAAVPISMIDPLLSNFLYTRQLRLALAQGDRQRVVRGLVTEVTNLASLGGERRLARARRLTDLVADAVQTSNDPYSVSMVHCARALLTHMSADFGTSLPHHEAWEQALRAVPGASFELGTALTFSVLALGYLGRFNALAERLPPVLREIDDRGNLLHGTNLRLIGTMLHLRADRPDEALARADAAISAWPGQGFHLQHYFHLIAAVQAHIYRGDAQTAWALVTESWPRLRSSLFLSVRAMADEMRFLRARAALALAASGSTGNGSASALLAQAASDARKISRSRLGWSAGLGATIEGAVLVRRGQRARAAEVLANAATNLDGASMRIAAAATRMIATTLRAPSNGAAATEAETLRQEGIANPERFAAMLLPGFSERSA